MAPGPGVGPESAPGFEAAFLGEERLQELLVGVWVYGSKKAYAYEVEYPSDDDESLGLPLNCLHFRQRLAKGSLSGILETRSAAPTGPEDLWTSWMEAALRGDDGEPRGRIRLRPLAGQGAVVSSFMNPSADEWGGETTARRVPRPYLVDRGALPRGAQAATAGGVAFHRSPEPEDKDDSQAPWGSVVVGVDLGNDWLRVVEEHPGTRYLPMRISKTPVLFATEREWRCEPRNGCAVGIRFNPYFDGPLVGEEIRPGETFAATLEYKGADAILHLRLSDGRGWVPVRHAYAGQLCVPCPGPSAAPSEEEKGQSEVVQTALKVLEAFEGSKAAKAAPEPTPPPPPPASERPPAGSVNSFTGSVVVYNGNTGLGFVSPDGEWKAELDFRTEHLSGIDPVDCKKGLRVVFDVVDVAGQAKARNVRPSRAASTELPACPVAADTAAVAADTAADASKGEAAEREAAAAKAAGGMEEDDSLPDDDSPPVSLDRSEVQELLAAAGGKADPGEQEAVQTVSRAETATPEALALRVHGLAGPLCTVEAHRGWNVREVKAAIEAQARVPHAEQRLLCGDLEPREAELLGCLPPGDSVDLVLVRRRPEEAEWLAAAEENWRSLEKAPEWVRSSHEVMYAVVQQAGNALHFASDELRRDRSVVLAAVGQNGHSVSFASEVLRTDREVALASVRQSGMALQLLAREMGAEREVVLAAVQQNGLAIEYSAPELKADLEVVLAAVQQNGLALQYVSLKLRTLPEVVLPALRQNGLALRFAPQDLRSDMQVVLAAVRQNGLALEHARQDLRADLIVALAAVQQHKRAIELTAPKLKADAGFIHAAVQHNGLVLQHASQALRSSSDVVLAAVKQNGLSLQFAAQELRAAPKIVLAAVEQNGLALQFAAQDLRKDLRVVLKAARRDEAALRFAAPRLEGRERDLAEWRRVNGREAEGQRGAELP